MLSRWMPLMATVPPWFKAFSAATTTAPAGAKVTAASSGVGGSSKTPPADTAPSSSARRCSASERVATCTSQPQRAGYLKRQSG